MAGSLLGCGIPYVTAALFDRHARPFPSGLAQNRRRNSNQGKERETKTAALVVATELFVPVPRRHS